ncbi:MAG: helix-turn-helix transcriptional regulator [Clostridia bacterium]|nr:helix-turn-helix transcriptional regulator [Clostridia bacterium]
MKTICISKNITDLRKKRGMTQEQLAAELNISPQAVSKWETETSQPDTQMLPQIADYFGVSIDYLFYGQDYSYDEIYEKVLLKIKEHPQMCKEAYEDVLKIFGYAHHGLIKGSFKPGEIYDEPVHITNENGVSLLSGKGYGAVLTRGFFENINKDTVEFAMKLLPALADKTCFLICLAIVSMSDISFSELKEKLASEEEQLRPALDKLITAGIVVEKISKHKSRGYTYEITDMYHTCLCILIATIEMQRYSLKGISCCMGYGDYPISL